MNAHQKIQNVTEAIALVPESRSRGGRRTKFTPERVQQIINLVERGKKREEIAEIIGVTAGSLQVACSKLGISLRQPRFDTGTGTVRRPRPPRENTASSTEQSSHSLGATQNIKNERDQLMAEEVPTNSGEPSSARPQRGTEGSASVTLAIRMYYKGKERTRELPLPQDMIGRLALEAEFRGMNTGDLIAQLIAAVIENDMVEVVLGQSRSENLELDRPAPGRIASAIDSPGNGGFIGVAAPI